MFFTVLCLSRK